VLFRKRSRRRLVQCPGIDLVAGARVDLGHNRIVAGDETIGVAREALDGLPAHGHVAHIINDRKRAAPLQIGVVMRGIGRQHHRPARGLDLDHLQAVGMAADTVHGDAGRDLAIAAPSA